MSAEGWASVFLYSLQSMPSEIAVPVGGILFAIMVIGLVKLSLRWLWRG